MHKLLTITTVNKDVSYGDETKLLGCDYIEDVDGWPVLVYDNLSEIWPAAFP